MAVYYQEGKKKKLVFGGGHNCTRPLEVAELLQNFAEHLSEMYSETGLIDGKQPFLVDDVVVSLSEGFVTMYYHEQGVSDEN